LVLVSDGHAGVEAGFYRLACLCLATIYQRDTLETHRRNAAVRKAFREKAGTNGQ
jgi:hypothetical protein